MYCLTIHLRCICGQEMHLSCGGLYLDEARSPASASLFALVWRSFNSYSIHQAVVPFLATEPAWGDFRLKDRQEVFHVALTFGAVFLAVSVHCARQLFWPQVVKILDIESFPNPRIHSSHLTISQSFGRTQHSS